MSRTTPTWLRRAGIALAIGVAFVLGIAFGGPSSNVATDQPTVHAEGTVWTCSMHPSVQLLEPGSCPICGMDLIALPASDDGPRSLTLSPDAARIAEIQTSPVQRRAVEAEVRMVGKLEADETRVREISAWVSGRIDRLYIDYTGVAVRSGQKLFELYSPELYSAQEELLQAITAAEHLSRSNLESTRRSGARTVEAARERLRLWGLTTSQIEEIVTRGTSTDHVPIVAPMSGVVLHKAAVEGTYVKTGTHVYSIADLSVLWLKLDVYEADLARITLGQAVEFQTEAYPGETFTGTVSFIDPMLNERSRSVKVRVDVENEDGRLKPGMFARALVRVAISGDGGQLPLVIPASAPLITGTRAVVYVEDPEEVGRYQGREVALGARAGGFYVVRDGLDEGERVVSNGTFKIDSALQIQAKPSMMNPSGGAPAPTHRHGAAQAAPSSAGDGARSATTPPEFLRQFDLVLQQGFAVSTALSLDDLGGAQQAARDLARAVLEPRPAFLASDGHEPWGQVQSDVARLARGLATAEDLSGARLTFYDLSQILIQAVRRFGASGGVPVLVYHCPMAMEGSGADWLQSREGTENPYYGPQMYRCGSQTEVLVAAQDAPVDHSRH